MPEGEEISLAVVLYIPSAFDAFKREGELIGRMVIEYGEMEWDLCLLIGHITGDANAAIKAMYRSRGETQRIDIADALARNRLTAGRVRTIYEETIAHMRVCLKLRNQYAHTNWIDSPTHGLCFVNIEEIAKSTALADPSNLQLYKIDRATIEDQQGFFFNVMQNVRYLSMEIQHLSGSAVHKGFHYVTNIQRPREAVAV